MKRNVYLKMKTLLEAKEIWNKVIETGTQGTEGISVLSAYGRTTARAVFANNSSPHYHSAAMDGVAVRANDTIGASESSHKHLILGNKTETYQCNPQAVFINTGQPLPLGFDAVIKIEDIYINGDQIEIQSSIPPWHNIRMVGEDIVAGEMILPTNHKIRAQDIGAMLSGGITEIQVRKRPGVVIIPTGKELVHSVEELKNGCVIEYNSYVLTEMIKEYGGSIFTTGIIRDDTQRLKEQILQSVKKADLILIIAGSSAGSEDYTPQAIKELGELLIHGVTIMPGKPVALGIVQSKPIIGIPGYPVSAWIATEEFVKPAIFKMIGLPVPNPKRITATIAQKIPSRLGLEEFIRVNLGYFDVNCQYYRFIALPQKQGAGIINSLVNADGILRIPRLCEGFEANSMVEVELLRNEEDIKNNIILIGSHDNTLDILRDELKLKYPYLNLSITSVGSLGGLLAIKRGYAHLATSHLLDENTCEYNISDIKRILPDVEVVLINLVWREQGLIVKKGNPKGIKGLEDLIRNVTFINRQTGAGTRVLLDYELKKREIDPSKINGYTTEVFTHMAVVSAIESGRVDVGLGIKAAADSMGLDFIPLCRDRYDLIIPKIYYNTPNIQALLEIVNSAQFKKRIEDLGDNTSIRGYDICDCGKIIHF